MSIKYLNLDKLGRAKVLAGISADEKKILECYVKLGGAYEGSFDDTSEVKKRGRKKKK